MKLKFPNLLKQLGTMIQQNYWCFYPSELIYFALFTMRHPVSPTFYLWKRLMKKSFFYVKLWAEPVNFKSSVWMSNSHWQFMLVMVKKCHHYQKIYKKSHATLLGYNTHPQGLPRLSGYFYCSCQLDNVAHKIITHKSRGTLI